ncbi:1-acylglycerol-3-phosphate O-acyltransferase [Corallincola platygyrae]|uniref:1-acyl-sn-glycerol-3-phosphate acyltransferase n=1 Tax=Corallincola platygyrae TaxID=1193278 RepID=A0ABW4XQ18_9GAMM
MLAVIRVLLMLTYLIIFTVPCVLFCLLRPFHPNLMHWCGRPFSWMVILLGMRLRVKVPESVAPIQSAVYVANHQNVIDILALAGVLRPRTVSVGKQSLAYIPLFGLLYWVTGNILINRSNSRSAAGTIKQVVKAISDKQMSVWMFPEGTRSHGRGLLPFKSGAFRVAQKAGVPIVPVVVSDLEHVRWNKWNNGYLTVEYLDPIAIYPEDDVRKVMKSTHALMAEQLDRINGKPTEDAPKTDGNAQIG